MSGDAAPEPRVGRGADTASMTTLASGGDIPVMVLIASTRSRP